MQAKFQTRPATGSPAKSGEPMLIRLWRWMRVGLTDLRGDLSRFGVIIACLVLGTATIATVGSVGSALKGAIDRDTAAIIGGDIEITRQDRRATPAEMKFFRSLGDVAEVIDSVGRATSGGNEALIDLVAVSANYPLRGSVASPELTGGEKPARILRQSDGQFSLLAEPRLLDRLGIGIGGIVRIGGSDFVVAGTLDSLPDGAARGFQLGLTVLMTSEAYASLADFRTPLPGLLTSYRYKIQLNTLEFDAAKSRIEATLDTGALKIRSPRDAAGTLARYYDLFARYLLIVGLASLLIGGVGVSNGVASYLSERRRTIAILRTLGATSQRIMVHFLTQIGVLIAIGVGLGILLGALASLAIMPLVGRVAGVQLDAYADPVSLVFAAAFGLLAGFAFAFPPLKRAERTSPALLFRTLGPAPAPDFVRGWRNWLAMAPAGIAVVGVLALALGVTGDPKLVAFFALGVGLSFVLLRGASLLLQRGLRGATGLPMPSWRIALRSIVAPGSPAPIVIISIGLGLAVLLVIALIADNLHTQLLGSVSQRAPTLIVTDLFSDEVDAIETFSATSPDVERAEFAPLLRGEIVSVNGADPRERGRLSEEAEFMLERDIPMTWRRGEPADGKVVAGAWWPPDYAGPPLVSLRATVAAELGAHVGDPIELRLFGDLVEARIANFRSFDYQQGINPFVIFSPGEIENFPATAIGTLKARPGHERALETALDRTFSEISFIPIGDALGEVIDLVGELGAAVNAVGAIAVLNGLFVLAGTLAAGRKQREADAVIHKVLGATRRNVLMVFVIEYGLLGLFSALIATLIGSVAAGVITRSVLNLEFFPNPVLIAGVIAGAIVVTILAGVAMTWRALSRSPASALRGG